MLPHEYISSAPSPDTLSCFSGKSFSIASGLFLKPLIKGRGLFSRGKQSANQRAVSDDVSISEVKDLIILGSLCEVLHQRVVQIAFLWKIIQVNKLLGINEVEDNVKGKIYLFMIVQKSC